MWATITLSLRKAWSSIWLSSNRSPHCTWKEIPHSGRCHSIGVTWYQAFQTCTSWMTDQCLNWTGWVLRHGSVVVRRKSDELSGNTATRNEKLDADTYRSQRSKGKKCCENSVLLIKSSSRSISNRRKSWSNNATICKIWYEWHAARMMSTKSEKWMNRRIKLSLFTKRVLIKILKRKIFRIWISFNNLPKI